MLLLSSGYEGGTSYSEAKDLAPGNEILRFAQDDKLVFSILTALARTRTRLFEQPAKECD